MWNDLRFAWSSGPEFPAQRVPVLGLSEHRPLALFLAPAAAQPGSHTVTLSHSLKLSESVETERSFSQ